MAWRRWWRASIIANAPEAIRAPAVTEGYGLRSQNRRLVRFSSYDVRSRLKLAGFVPILTIANRRCISESILFARPGRGIQEVEIYPQLARANCALLLAAAD